jgi:hypothetical protein
MKKIAIRSVAVALAVAGLATAQTKSSQFVPSVESLMSAAEFRTTGLQKLSPEELAALNRWLGKYTAAVTSALEQSPSPNAPSTVEAIESHIDGDFEGWEGETIFKLDNGQIWQQAGYAYTYHFAYHPKVIIYRTGGTYRMKVEDVSDTIPVKRLK